MPSDFAYEEIDHPLHEAQFEGYVQTVSVRARPSELFPGAAARTLSADPAIGRSVLLLEVGAGFARAPAPLGVSASLDLVVLEGTIDFASDRLVARDFAFVPPGVVLPPLASTAGAQFLVFVDPPFDNSHAVEAQRARGPYVTRYDDQRWRAATLVRDAGLELDLQVQLLKQDPVTGARTWYVRQGVGGKVPWERHSVVEEGFLIAGEYRLAERLPGRTVIGNYAPGGYFRRPPGVLHSGPLSGTRTGAIWLQRAPAALDVTFVEAQHGVDLPG
jgi:hypothetical protein